MSAPGRIRLRLYVAGPSPRSARTIDSIRRLCEGPLAGGCDLEIVDLYQQPGLAAQDGVVAAPTLLRLSPLPARRVSGDLTDERRVLATLGLDAAGASPLQAAQQQQQQDLGIGGADA
ncbi:circadian clock KaiB family protein [Methylorubrum sp. SB2]|uniref:circadian clock KaiB family protein n=1 Tax=Methylorubrum subtropicum TaxID=3138812 RepID=UPI00313CC00A